MKTYTTTVHLAVPPEEAFDRVIELMTKSAGRIRYTTIAAPPGGEGTMIRYELRLLGVGIGGVLTLTDYVRGETVTLNWHGPERFAVGDLRGEWAFAPEDGGTRVTIHSCYTPKVPILHDLGARMMMRTFRNSELPAMKAEIEARAATAPDAA